MTDPTPPVQPKTPPGSKTFIYQPQIRVVIASGGQEIDVSRDVIRGRVIRAVDAVSQFEVYLHNKNGKYTGRVRRMDKIVVWMKRVRWIQVFTGYLDVVPAYDLFPTEAYLRASCTLKRVKYTYWDKGLPESQNLLNPWIPLESGKNATLALQSPDAGTGIIIHDLLTKVGNWPENQVLIQQIPTKFMDFMKQNIRLVDQQEVFNRLLRYINGSGMAGGQVYPWSSSAGNVLTPSGANGGLYTQDQIISMIKGIWGSAVSGISEDKIDLAAAYVMAVSNGDPNYHFNDGTRDRWGLFGLDHLGASGKVKTTDQLKDPVENIKQALIASGQGTLWSYWSSDLGLGNVPSTLASVQQASPSVAAWNPTAAPTNPAVNLNSDIMQQLFEKFYGQAPNERVQAVINYALSKKGIKYGSPNPRDGGGGAGDGSDSPPTFDCSGLIMMAYRTINVSFSHSAIEQARKSFNYQVPRSGGGDTWTIADLQPGDLLFFVGSAPDKGGDGVPDIGHVAMYIGNDQIVEANGPDVHTASAHDRLDGTTDKANFVTRPINMAFALNDATGTWTSSNENGGVGTEYRLFNFLFRPDYSQTALSELLMGDFAPANDESLLTSIAQVCQGSMRSFMSGPNGDFIAFFPDYFGINNTQAVWDIEDVEIIDLKLQVNDDELVTHVYTIGDTQIPGSGTVSSADWLASSGEVSIMTKAIMDQVLAMQPSTGFLSDPKAFIQRYGLRPMTNQLSIIRSHYYEFFASLYTFMKQWSKQYSTTVSIGFMPELFPGMRMNLVNHDVCVYVENVVHTFDFQTGFQTYPTISCPSTPAGGDGGLPIAMGL